jgi:hypothetical protein
VYRFISRRIPWFAKNCVYLTLAAVVIFLIGIWAWSQHPFLRRARALVVIQRLHTLNARIEYYRSIHQDKDLSAEELSDWKPLLGESFRTRLGTRLDSCPLLIAPPKNLVTGSAWVVPAGQGSITDGWTWDWDSQKLRLIVPRKERRYFFSIDSDDIEVAEGSAVPPPLPGTKNDKLSRLEPTLMIVQTMELVYEQTHGVVLPARYEEVIKWKFPPNPLNDKSKLVGSGLPYDEEAGWTCDVWGRLRVVVPLDLADDVKSEIGDHYIEIYPNLK